MKRFFSILCVLSLLSFSGCRTLKSEYSHYSYFDSSDIVISSQVSQTVSEVSEISSSSETTQSYYEVENSSISSNSSNTKTENSAITTPSASSSQSNKTVNSQTASQNTPPAPEADVYLTCSKPLNYSILSTEQQRIYRIIKAAVEQMNEETLSLGNPENTQDRMSDIAVAFKAMCDDNPELFWTPFSYGTSEDGSYLSFANCFFVNKENLAVMKSKLDSVVNYVKTTTASYSRFEKEVFIHDYICNVAKYTTTGNDLIFTAYGALVNGEAVCEGYSKAMQLLCDNVGIPCALIYGNSNGQAHMWNVVDPGDGWYNIDVTWDDDSTNNCVRYAYFNLSDQQIAAKHTIAPTLNNSSHYTASTIFNIKKYNCNSASYNYFTKKGLIFDQNLQDVATKTIAAYESGAHNIELLYNHPQDANTAINSLQSVITSKFSPLTITNYSMLGNSILLIW